MTGELMDINWNETISNSTMNSKLCSSIDQSQNASGDSMNNSQQSHRENGYTSPYKLNENGATMAVSLGSDDYNGSYYDENKTNLIVNYLPPNMSQDDVRILFSRIGDVESCKLVRDKTTGESLGYAFVKFFNSAEADNAIQTLNGLRLQNKTIKVSLARPSSEAIKGANLYICGLPKRMTQKELEKLFSQCGKIITARILYDNKTGFSRGVAFIRFDQRHEAECAIKKLNGCAPEGASETITVKYANSPSAVRQDNIGLALLKQASQLPPSPTATPTHTSTSRSNLMSPLQQVASLARMSRYTGMDFMHSAAAMTSNSLLGPTFAAQAGAMTPTGWCIFVYSLAPDTEDAALWQLFGPFGAVQTVKVIRDTISNKCRGFGFVTMSNYEEALFAINSLDGHILNNRMLQVKFKTNPSTRMKNTCSPVSSNPMSPIPSVPNSSDIIQLHENLYLDSGHDKAQLEFSNNTLNASDINKTSSQNHTVVSSKA